MMSRLTLSALVSLSVAFVAAQGPTGTFPSTPLASKHFAYDQLPEKVDTDNLIRGTQVGYNNCVGKPDSQSADCQTLHFNDLTDFCFWAPREKKDTIGNIEGLLVSWCTKKGHGSRLVPEGTIQGGQWIRTPAYVQFKGFIQQEALNILADDYGGEMDPHGADLRGNPMGGLVYSQAFGARDNRTYTQVIEWHNFIGGNATCFKACDPANADAPHFCEHVFDRIGADYNCPGTPTRGVFEVCDGDVQDFPGTYTLNGAVQTYTQPAESLGAISSMPYTARIPASSNCVEYKSKDLWPDLVGVAGASSVASATPTKSGSTSKPTGSSSRTGTAGAQSTGNAASTLAVSSVSVFGIILSALFFS